jgi:hypothetical protein
MALKCRKEFDLLRSMSRRYVIDEVTIFTNSVRINIGSDFWHRDGVGHRIKLFIPVIIHGIPPTTDFFKRSHLLSCHPFAWEMLRIGGSDPDKHEHQSIIEARLSELFGNPYHFEWSYDRIFFLDTNAIHRASNFHSGTINSYRHFLIIEFMDPTSSKIAHRFRLGQCNTKINSSLINIARYYLQS